MEPAMTRAKLSLATSFAALLAVSAFAAAPAVAADLKVGVVDPARLVQESPQAKTAIAALEAEFGPKQRQLEQAAKDLKARKDKAATQAATMSEAEKGKLDRDLRDAERDLTRRANEFQEDVNVRRNEELSRVQRVVLQEVANYAKANGYDLVLADGVLYATTAQSKVVALEAATGRELWRYIPTEPNGLNRGLAGWSDGNERRLLFGNGHWLHAIDPATPPCEAADYLRQRQP
jgi:outer membrane protein